MIELKNISLQKGSNQILKNISFNTLDNEILAIIGPNGAGKTSLINIISGIEKDYTGEISINGNLIDTYNVDELSKIRSVVSQKVDLNLPFKSSDIVLMGLNHNNSEPESLVKKSLDLVEANHLIDRNYLELSGGEQQRIQIARALSQIYFLNDSNKRFLLLDEPTSNLDLSNSFKILSLLSNLSTKNISMLWIVHDINLALKYANRFLLLKDGELLSIGTKEDILKEEILSELYGMKLKIFRNEDQSFVLPN